MRDPALATLMQRIDTLEADRRWWRTTAAAVSLIFCAIIFIGQAAPRAALKTVEAERFVLTGRSGKARAVLTEASDGNVGLRFVDSADRMRIAFEVQPDGAPWVSLADSTGKRRFMLTVNNNGSPAFSLLNAQERALLGVTATPDGVSGIMITDAAGKTRAIFGVLSGGSSLVSVHANDGGIRGALSVVDDAPSVKIYDPKGKVIWKSP